MCIKFWMSREYEMLLFLLSVGSKIPQNSPLIITYKYSCSVFYICILYTFCTTYDHVNSTIFVVTRVYSQCTRLNTSTCISNTIRIFLTCNCMLNIKTLTKIHSLFRSISKFLCFWSRRINVEMSRYGIA